MNTIHWPILRNALRHPRAVAAIDDQRTWRYVDLVAGAFYLAQKLERLSASRQVGIMLPTGGAFPMSLLAIWMLRRTAVPVNYLLSADERQYIVDDSEMDTVITAGPMLEFLGAAPRHVNLLELDQLSFRGIPELRWPALPGADENAVILYTSGTSGRPKGVMLTHRNLRSNIEAARRHASIGPEDSVLGVLPQFHSFGLTVLTLLPLHVGARSIYTARFVPRKLVQLLRKHRPTMFAAIPSMYNALLTVKDLKADDLSSLTHAVSGGEPLPMAVFHTFQDRFQLTIREGYGLTETSPVISWGTPQSWKHGSVGSLVPGVECRVVDEAGRVLAAGEEGEACFRGPNIMAGYFKQPELTRSVIDEEGFFRTGDWGRLDAEGFLFITGRKKEMLIIGGENVFPREIEEVLNGHPAIHDSAVVARVDPIRGELPVAFVEINGEEDFDEQEVRTFCRGRLAGFKVPREIRVIEALPRNATGKILRRELQP